LHRRVHHRRLAARPYAALVIIVVAMAYSIFLSRRDPGLGDRVGSIVADE
jgi:hypothetical protein